jgi:hypothetical protein
MPRYKKKKKKNYKRKKKSNFFKTGLFFISFFLITSFFIYSWWLHVSTSINQEEWMFLLVGGVIFPVGILNGLYIWINQTGYLDLVTSWLKLSGI